MLKYSFSFFTFLKWNVSLLCGFSSSSLLLETKHCIIRTCVQCVYDCMCLSIGSWNKSLTINRIWKWKQQRKLPSVTNAAIYTRSEYMNFIATCSCFRFISFHFIKGWDGDDNLEFSFYQQATAVVGEHERVSYFRINFSFTSSPRERKSQMNNQREKGASGHARVPLKPLHLPLSVVHFETERQSAKPASPLPTVYCNDGDDVCCCCCCCCCLYNAQPARVLLLWMTLGVNPMHGFLDSIILGPSRPLKQAT